MDFQTAVRTCLQKKYLDFNGRAARAEYWYFVLFYFLAIIVASVLDGIVGLGRTIGPFYGLAVLALIVPSLAVGVRRLHDLGKSGWLILIGLIPLVGFIVLIVWFVGRGTVGDNQYGPDPLAGVPATPGA